MQSNGIRINDDLLQFNTYNGSLLRKLKIDNETVELILENRQYQLKIKALRDAATTLASPVQGFMDGRIEESMSSNMKVHITGKKTGMTIFEDSGRNTALEVAGKIDELLRPFRN